MLQHGVSCRRAPARQSGLSAEEAYTTGRAKCIRLQCRVVPARMGAPAGLYPSLLQTSQQQLAGADAAQEHVPSTRIPFVP
jgi:hypothetical protein